MRRRGFTKGVVAGSILGITAATYLAPILGDSMKSKTFRRMKRDSRGVVSNIVDLANDIKNMM
jgi:gas vesicle protein